MYGQLKSTVTCLTCTRVANSYDPYLSICLPIVKESRLTLYFVSDKSHSQEDSKFEIIPALQIEVPVNKSQSIGDLKTALVSTADLRGKKKDELAICSWREGKIGRVHQNTESVDQIEQDDR